MLEGSFRHVFVGTSARAPVEEDCELSSVVCFVLDSYLSRNSHVLIAGGGLVLPKPKRAYDTLPAAAIVLVLDRTIIYIEAVDNFVGLACSPRKSRVQSPP